jgi:2-oxoglutarate ferredoxin oxidoreductase subunit beta
MSVMYKRPASLTDVPYTYCSGCSHGIITTIAAECLDELGITGDTISVASVGCGGMTPMFFNTDTIVPMHGRAPATATGIKRIHPDKIVWTYQGDGDLASIGVTEIVHAALRGERITVIFVNNANYGMTGGQMAPTTLIGQKTTTTPTGRDEEWSGKPLRVSEMLATLDGAKFIARVSVDTPANRRKAKTAVMNAFRCQIDNRGFAMVEFLATCPTNWKKSPIKSFEWLRENMIPYFPLGILKDEK